MTPTLREALASRRDEVISALRERADAPSFHPVSFNQRALWFLYQCDPTSAAYNVAFAVRVRSCVNVRALAESFQALIDRHPILRTTYDLVQNELCQVVHPSARLAFTEIDATQWAETILHEEVARCYREPFDLQRGPVVRVHLFRIREDEHVLLLSAHHIAVDGWSVWVLLEELHSLYRGRTQNTAVILPRSPVEYTDYARTQAALLAGPEGEHLWEYWRRKLAGQLPVLDLPTDRPRPAMQTFSGASHRRRLPADLHRDLKEVAKAVGATPFVVSLSAYFILLHQYTRQLDLIVGSPTLGRSRVEYRSLVGDCIGMVPLRVDVSGDPSFRDVVERVRKTVVDALDHEDLPFPLMVERLAPQRDFSRSPVFQTTFMLQKPHSVSEVTSMLVSGETPGQLNIGGLLMETYPVLQQEGQFDLSLEIVEAGDAWDTAIKYNSALFDPTTAERLLERYYRLLQIAVADTTTRLSTLALSDTGRLQTAGPRSALKEIFMGGDEQEFIEI